MYRRLGPSWLAQPAVALLHVLFAREVPWIAPARELLWRGHLLMIAARFSIGITGIALTVAGVSLGLTLDQLRSRDAA